MRLAAAVMAVACAVPVASPRAEPADAPPSSGLVLASYSPAVTLAELLGVASEPTDSASRRDARSRLFREIVPRMPSEGRPATNAEAVSMLGGLGGYPCACGPLRVASAQVLGDAAKVAIAGGKGGCNVLMRRDGDGWAFVMILGWTLSG